MRGLRLTLIEVGDVPDQYRRPYKLTMDGRTVNIVRDTIERSGGNVRPSMLANILGESLAPSTEVETVRPTEGSWQDARYRFILEVEVEEPSRYGNGLRVIVCGYTDRVDTSHNGHLAPDLRMYVNSIVGVSDWYDTSRGQPILRSRVTDNYQVMLGEYNPGVRGGSDWKMRPVDIFNTLELNDELKSDDPNEETVDTRSSFTQGVDTNRRCNNQRTHYLTRLITADAAGGNNASVFSDQFTPIGKQRNAMAADNIQETTVYNNRFLELLMRNNDTSKKLRRKGYFEFEDLCVISSNGRLDGLDDIVDVYDRRQMRNSYESESWRSGRLETVIANTIAQEVPSIMVDCLMSSLSFTCSNMTPYRFNPDDNTEFAVLDATTFIAGDFGKEIFKVFENRFLLEVFKMISRNGEIGITLEVDVEISGGTTIDIGIDGQPLERYYFPTFCDSLLVPTLTEDSRNLDDLANRYRIIRRDVVNPVLVNVDGSPLRDDSSTVYTPDRPFKIF